MINSEKDINKNIRYTPAPLLKQFLIRECVRERVQPKQLIDKSNWTNFKPIEYDNYYKSQWCDLCFISEKKLFELLDFRINEIPIKGKHKNFRFYFDRTVTQFGYSNLVTPLSLTIGTNPINNS